MPTENKLALKQQRVEHVNQSISQSGSSPTMAGGSSTVRP
jgi:hypothetical protein